MSNFQVKSVSMGGRVYLSQESLLDFLDNRARLVVTELKVHNRSLTDTEYLRGQAFEQEKLKNAIQPPTPTAR